MTPHGERVTLDVQYEAGHSYQESYQLCELFCLHCGAHTVWQEQSAGDYYVGERFICATCGKDFTCQPSDGRGWQNQQRLEAIRQTIRNSHP